jgi:hypothetical protein
MLMEELLKKKKRRLVHSKGLQCKSEPYYFKQSATQNNQNVSDVTGRHPVTVAHIDT